MANDLNQCQFIGRAGSDPEVRYTPAGDAVCNLGIAVGWKTKEKEGVEWVRCAFFGKLAEIVGEYVTKGKQIFVSGRMSTREYEKEGVKHYITEVRCDRMQLLGSRDGGEGQGERSGGQQRQAPARSASSGQQQRAARQQGADDPFGDMDSDIPW